MIKMNIELSAKDEESKEHKHVVSVERSHYDGYEVNNETTCDVLLKIFITLLKGMGYYKESIHRCMVEYLVEEDIIDEPEEENEKEVL